MKRIILVLAILFVVFLSTSYEELIVGRTEIENLYPITLAGIDKNNKSDTNNYLMTTVAPTTEEDAVKPDNIMTITGKTAFEANRMLGTYAEKDIYWGHNQYILIGEEAAKEDVFKYLDFFMRDNEPRLTTTPLVIMGGTSQEAINLLYEQNIDVSKTVNNVVANLNLTSYSSSMELVQFINLMSQSQDGYLPCLQLKAEKKDLRIEQGSEEIIKGEYKNENQRTNQDVVLHLPGYAVIKDGKVIDYLLNEQGRGLSWIINKIVSGVIVVEHEGVKYNLEIVQGGSDIKPIIEGDQLRAEIKVNVWTNITEISKQNIAVNDELIQILQEKLSKIVDKEVTEVVEIAQKDKVDIIGIGDKFHHRYPVKWENKYKNQWEDIFPDLEIKVVVEPRSIKRSARFYESIINEEGK